MASLGATLLGASRPLLAPHAQTRKPLLASGLNRSAARSLGGRRIGALTVRAIAAPEKPTNEEPFTAWGTAVERVPKRTDLKTIMILGAGPIVIGQVSKRNRS